MWPFPVHGDMEEPALWLFGNTLTHFGFQPRASLATTGPRPRIQLCADRECSLILSPFKFEVQFIGMGAIWLTLVVL